MTTPLGLDDSGALGAQGADEPMGFVDQPIDWLPQVDEQSFVQAKGIGRLPGLTDAQVPMPSLKGVDGVRAKVVQSARDHVGVPYVWGGTSSNGWDCSGAMQWLWGQYGVQLPRISAQQAMAGKRITQDQARPGDLVAFNNGTRNGGPQAEHIAMYLGGGLIFEAPRPGVASRIRKLGSREGDHWFVGLNV